MEQVSDEELDHGAEEDSDKEDQDLDKMFGAWLGELDKLTQVKKTRTGREGWWLKTQTHTGGKADRMNVCFHGNLYTANLVSL